MFLMNVFQPQHALGEPTNDLVFGKGRPHLLRLLDLLVQVTAFTILLHDTEPSVFEEGLFVSNNVRVIQPLKQLLFA